MNVEYFIYCAKTILELEVGVNEKIRLDGFKPIGGVAIQVDSRGFYMFYQSMIKENEVC